MSAFFTQEGFFNGLSKKYYFLDGQFFDQKFFFEMVKFGQKFAKFFEKYSKLNNGYQYNAFNLKQYVLMCDSIHIVSS